MWPLLFGSLPCVLLLIEGNSSAFVVIWASDLLKSELSVSSIYKLQRLIKIFELQLLRLLTSRTTTDFGHKRFFIDGLPCLKITGVCC